MILRPFQYAESKTLEDAVAALRTGGEDARVIAGGTALVPLMPRIWPSSIAQK